MKMEDLEKQIREHSQNNQLELPDDLSWDNFEKQAYPKKRRKGGFLFLLAALLLGLGFLGYVVSSNFTSFPQTQTAAPEQTISQPNSTETIAEPQLVKSKSKSENSPSPKDDTKSSNQTIAKQSKSTPEASSKTSTNSTKSPITSVTPSNSPNTISRADAPFIVLSQKEIGNITPKQSRKNPTIITVGEVSLQTEVPSSISSLPEETPQTKPSKTSHKNSIGLHLGTSFILNPIPSWGTENTSAFPGFHAAISFQHQFDNTILFEGQLAYNIMQYLFQYNGTYYKQEFQQNVLIAHYDIHGFVYEEFKDTTVTVKVDRNIQTYNVLKTINVPLLIGYPFSLGRGKIVAKAGLNLSFITYQKGKWVSADKSVQESSQSDPLYDNTINLQAQVGVEYNYNLAASYQAFISCNSIFGLNSWSSQYNIKPFSLNTSIGLRYSF